MSLKTSCYFKPYKVGNIELSHRIVMAPLTRVRNDNDLCPTDIAVKHYSDRATKGGLLVSEATYISPQTIGHNHAPGIWLPKQVEAWKHVTDAVHKKGGYISCQLWHIGYRAHESFSEHHLVKGTGYTTCWSSTDQPMKVRVEDINGVAHTTVTPKKFTVEMIQQLKQDYITAAKNAISAGFDFIELHSAHSYLPQQFFSSGVNILDGIYGPGSNIENRFRFFSEVIELLCKEVGKEKVGVRISPHSNDEYAFDCPEPHYEETFNECIRILNIHKPAYVLFTEPRWDPKYSGDSLTDERLTFPSVNGMKYASQLTHSVPIGATGFTPLSGAECIDENIYPCIAFGRYFISNPDLVYRIQNGFPLNVYNRSTFYVSHGQSEDTYNEGYNDYPTFEEVVTSLGYTVEHLKESPEAMEELVAKSSSTKYPLVSIEKLGNVGSLSQIPRK